MLISSRFHDYYDGMMKLGVDKTVVYDRKTVQTEDFSQKELDVPLSYSTTYKVKGWSVTFNKVVIGFCGKMYPLLYVVEENNDKSSKNIELFYDKDSFFEYMKALGLNSKSYERYYWDGNRLSITNERDMETYFDPKTWKKLDFLFPLYKVPVFVIAKDFFTENVKGRYATVLILNPKLKDFKFVRVKHMVNAWQELYNYISGVLGVPERSMIRLSDKELAKKRGHDDPYSFRKPPKRKK